MEQRKHAKQMQTAQQLDIYSEKLANKRPDLATFESRILITKGTV